jgi:hypothetical protein
MPLIHIPHARISLCHLAQQKERHSPYHYSAEDGEPIKRRDSESPYQYPAEKHKLAISTEKQMRSDAGSMNGRLTQRHP